MSQRKIKKKKKLQNWRLKSKNLSGVIEKTIRVTSSQHREAEAIVMNDMNGNTSPHYPDQITLTWLLLIDGNTNSQYPV
jgi:catechol-2,3-dioxygenase